LRQQQPAQTISLTGQEKIHSRKKKGNIARSFHDFEKTGNQRKIVQKNSGIQ
jgi:hypothetical protein